jgi:hypothetical protein
VADFFRVNRNGMLPGVISAAVKVERWFLAPVGLAVPQLYASNVAALAAQINGAGVATGGDALGHLDIVRGAVTVVNHDAAELDGASTNAELDLAERALRFGHLDIVVIHGAIHVGGAEEAPAPILLALPRQWKQEQQHKAAQWSDSVDSHVPPLETLSVSV